MGVDLDLSFRPAAEMAARVADRTESPAEMVERTLARIAEVRPLLNCFAQVWADEARS